MLATQSIQLKAHLLCPTASVDLSKLRATQPHRQAIAPSDYKATSTTNKSPFFCIGTNPSTRAFSSSWPPSQASTTLHGACTCFVCERTCPLSGSKRPFQGCCVGVWQLFECPMCTRAAVQCLLRWRCCLKVQASALHVQADRVTWAQLDCLAADFQQVRKHS